MSTAIEGWYDSGQGLLAWFEATSHAHAATLVGPVLSLVGDDHPRPLLDVRASGTRVRLSPSCPDAPGLALAITSAAARLGLAPVATGVRSLSISITSADPVRLVPFWQTVLDHDPADGGTRLSDPLSRRPDLTFEHADGVSSLRSRLHIDVGHPGAVAEPIASALAAGGSERLACEWYSTLADADGNEVDLVPGGPLGDAEVSDWRAFFGGMTCYPESSSDQTDALVGAAAGLADRAGLPLLIDVRPEAVVLDSGKDRWEQPGFTQLAAGIQREARRLELTGDPERLRFTQVGIDALDVGGVRAFWQAVLGYRPAADTRITDLFDPADLEPVVFFQEMEDDAARRRARNRLGLVLRLPEERVADLVQTAIGHGGARLDETTIADPEGNELRLVPLCHAAPAP